MLRLKSTKQVFFKVGLMSPWQPYRGGHVMASLDDLHVTFSHLVLIKGWQCLMALPWFEQLVCSLLTRLLRLGESGGCGGSSLTWDPSLLHSPTPQVASWLTSPQSAANPYGSHCKPPWRASKERDSSCTAFLMQSFLAFHYWKITLELWRFREICGKMLK